MVLSRVRRIDGGKSDGGIRQNASSSSSSSSSSGRIHMPPATTALVDTTSLAAILVESLNEAAVVAEPRLVVSSPSCNKVVEGGRRANVAMLLLGGFDG